MTNRLQRYLTSKGQVLPEDLFLYKAGEEKDHLCIFCAGPASSFQIIHYPQRGTTLGGTFTSANACYECSELVAAMESDLDGPPIRATLFEGLEDTAKARIESYVKYSQFDHSVTLHYQWLDVTAFPNARHCYFCKVQAYDDYQLIDTPVIGSSANLTGGRVRCCQACNFWIEREYGVSLNQLPADRRTRITIERCPSCGELYPIDQDERLYRDAYQPATIGKHSCPECAFEALEERDSMGKTASALAHRLLFVPANYLARFLNHRCEYCNEPFLVDITLEDKYLVDTHMSTSKRIMCHDCAQFGKDVITTVVNPDGKIVIVKQRKHLYILGHIPANDTRVHRQVVSGQFADILAGILNRYNADGLFAQHLDD